jgi:hypothetical protein
MIHSVTRHGKKASVRVLGLASLDFRQVKMHEMALVEISVSALTVNREGLVLPTDAP